MRSLFSLLILSTATLGLINPRVLDYLSLCAVKIQHILSILFQGTFAERVKERGTDAGTLGTLTMRCSRRSVERSTERGTG